MLKSRKSCVWCSGAAFLHKRPTDEQHVGRLTGSEADCIIKENTPAKKESIMDEKISIRAVRLEDAAELLDGVMKSL